ncbi:MAG: tetratricopeptide repeat protein [Bacteroidetes bacterium]|nr:tetratricopeptide repeat protein [Bacteroidota bacterium]
MKAKAIRSLSPIPLYRLGALSIGVNNGDQARKFFLECLKIEPNFALAKVKLALLDMQIDSKNSIRMLTEVIEKDPRNKEALFYRYILKQSSDATSALDDLNALIALSPIDYRLRVMRGLMLVKQKDYSLAFSDLKKALQATTINQDVFRGHQSALDQTIDIQAAGYYLIAHMYGLQDADIERIKKAYCLLLVNDYEGAINTVHEVRGYKSNAFCFFLIGIAQEHRGNHQSALSSYQSALKLDPQIWEAHKKVAIYNTSVGKWREAEQEFSAAIALNQDFNSLYKLRGVARFLSEDYQGADQDFTHFLKIDSLDEEAIRGRAEALVKLGKIDQAISEYFKVYDTARMNQFNFEGLEKTVDLMARKGDTLSAIKLLHRFFINTLHRPANDLKFALLLNQQNIQLLKIHLEGFETFVVRHPEVYKPQETYIIKAASYSRLGDFDLAESYFKKAIDFNPYNGWIHIYRGRMYLKMGRKKEAIREWKKSEALGVNEAKEELKKLKK